MSEGNQKKLFTTAEITLATGLPRGTITNRARKLGFERTGQGYTSDQVLSMVMMPMILHRRDENRADELRNTLNEMLSELDMPMEIVEQPDGHYAIEYWRRGKKVLATSSTCNGGER